jgi:hypothetical protein
MIIIAVVIALALPALAPRNLNPDSAPKYQSAQYCIPQDDELVDMMRIYC